MTSCVCCIFSDSDSDSPQLLAVKRTNGRIRKVDGPKGLIEERVEFIYAKKQWHKSNLRIIYNRIPKCGSLTVLTVLQNLARRNKYSFLSSREYNRVYIPYEQEKALVENLQGKQAPWVYNRHIKMLNFTHFRYDMPVYINIYRNPIDRKRSHFYYSSPHRHTMTFDECVQRKFKYCYKSNGMLGYFCSLQQKCDPGSRSTLQIAKHHVAKYYRVIGVTEDLESFFQLLEYEYPEMFTGALHVFRNTTSRNVDDKKSSHKVDTLTRKILKDTLSNEYEFYEFVKQRLENAKQEAGIL